MEEDQDQGGSSRPCLGTEPVKDDVDSDDGRHVHLIWPQADDFEKMIQVPEHWQREQADKDFEKMIQVPEHYQQRSADGAVGEKRRRDNSADRESAHAAGAGGIDGSAQTEDDGAHMSLPLNPVDIRSKITFKASKRPCTTGWII
eukprot:1580180-Rhodomonas_salina.1